MSGRGKSDGEASTHSRRAKTKAKSSIEDCLRKRKDISEASTLEDDGNSTVVEQLSEDEMLPEKVCQKPEPTDQDEPGSKASAGPSYADLPSEDNTEDEENEESPEEEEDNEIAIPSKASLEDLMAVMLRQNIMEKEEKKRRRKDKIREKKAEELQRKKEKEFETKRFEAQMTLIQQQFTASLDVHKSRTEKLDMEAEEKEARAKATQREENLDRVGKSLIPMHYGEDVFSLLLRFELTMTNRGVDRYNWVPLLERVLKGKFLEMYYANLSACAGNWNLMREKLLSEGGYDIHDCLDLFLSRYNSGGSLSASQWANSASHRFYIVSKSLPFLKTYPDEVHKAFADAFANASVLSSLSIDGRAYVYKCDLKSAQDVLSSCAQYMSKPVHTDRPVRHQSTLRWEKPHSFYSQKRFVDQEAQSHRNQPVNTPEHSDSSSITCFKCHKEGHYANRCPERRAMRDKPIAAPEVNKRASTISVRKSNDGEQDINAVENVKVSDSDTDDPIPDCLNMFNGQPKELDFTLKGSINGKDVVLQLDSGAEVSVVSSEFVSDRDIIATHRTLRGIDHVSTVVPTYMLPLNAPGIKGRCLFSVYSKLPPGSALLGRDLGDVFVQLLNRAKSTPEPAMSVMLTRAQSNRLLEEERVGEIKQAMEGAKPVPLDHIPDAVPECTDGVSVDLSNLVLEQGIDYQSVANPCTESLPEMSNVSTSDDPSKFKKSDLPISIQSDHEHKPISNSCPFTVSIPKVKFDGISKTEFIKLQREDDSLSHIWKWADNREKRCFVVEGVLMCLTNTNGHISHAVVVPKALRKTVLELAHDISGHFGSGASRALINSHFTWPGLNSEVRKYVKECMKCQLFNKGSPPKAPLVPPELLVERFEKLAVDVVGPIVKSTRGYRFVLTAMDLTTRFPFAMPMRTYTAEETAQNLISVFSVIGPPAAVLSDQGCNFMSKVLSCLYDKLAIQRIRTSPYHPETNGKLERFHSSLKAVLRKCMHDKKDWPAVLDLVLYFLRNLPHSRHGYTPFELTFIKPTPHILATLKSHWSVSSDSSINIPRFIADLDSNLSLTMQSFKERLHENTVSRRAEKEHKSLRNFKEGSLVMKRVPGLSACLEASWEGPFEITERVSDVNYRIVPQGKKGKGKIVHINMLKEYKKVSDVFAIVAVKDDNTLYDSESVNKHNIQPDLSDEMQLSLTGILSKHDALFTNKPGCTSTVSHKIDVTCDKPVWTPSFTIPAHVEQGFQKSLEELIELDIIEPSNSKWSSPLIPIVKKDGDVRIVVDYRKLNDVTVPEPCQMPTVGEILSRFGKAAFLSKLDLLKGFHQVPVEPCSREFTAFSCRHGKYHYKRMPFGLRNAPATFQLLMQKVLRGLEAFASPYIDDVIIFSVCWDDHLLHIDAVLSRLEYHGLSIKASKCSWGFKEFEFLGFVVGNGHLGIPEARVQQLRDYVKPRTVSQLRSFLGLATYYSKFIPRFADLTKPLTAHMTKLSPRLVKWTTDIFNSFNAIVYAISNSSILNVPDVCDSFCIFCDASVSGVGGVLCVYRKDNWVPVAFFSRQMKPREARYSATEIEALAMVASIDHFAYYITGKAFKVFTDHKALLHLFSSSTLNNRLWRWKVKLMDFMFTIVYIEGAQNVVADAMSRQGWPDPVALPVQEIDSSI